MTALRILVVTQYFWPETFRINDLVLALQKKGHAVTVLTGMPNYPVGLLFPGYGAFTPSHESYEGVTVRRVPIFTRGAGTGWRLLLNYVSFVLSASLLGPFLCRGRFDLIFVYEPSPVTVGLPALLLKRLKRARLFFWVQDLWPETLAATGMVRARWILDAVGHLVRFIYKGCDRILVQSRAFVEPVARFGIPLERICYFPNSAEEIYRPKTPPQQLSDNAALPQGFRIMFAGSVGAAQSFETILAAAERLRSHPEVHWVVAGEGRMLEWVRSEIAARGLHGCVHLIGRKPMETMPDYFALSDVMLVTLKDDPIFAMTIPAKLQSYLACGRPIIAALGGEGARVVTESGAGLSTPPEDTGALADAVLKMFRMTKQEREAMGARGRCYFEANFERNMLVERLDAWMVESAGAHR